MTNARVAPLLLSLLAFGCGGDSGGGGSAMDTENLPAFCQDALAGVQAFMASVASERQTGPEFGGRAVVGVISDIENGMNVFSTVDDVASQHQTFVNLMTLVQYDEELTPRPYLAQRWETSEDGRELTFFLREDVVWHDGTPTTAHDVAFTFRRAVDSVTQYPNRPQWSQYDASEDGVTVVDDFTIRFRLEPHLGAMEPWRAMAIMPAHLLEDVPSAELGGHPYGTLCPVGNGPFVFKGRVSGDSWTFDANPVFPEGLGGQAGLDRYVYRVIPDQNTLMAELAAGGVDVFMGPLIEQADQIRGNENLELLTYPFRTFAMVAWNARSPTLADKRVRQALTLATDRRALLQVLRGGYGRVANATVPPFHWAYDPGVEARMEYNPGAAERLLSEAGWVDQDGDGIRENGRGGPLEVRIAYNTENQERQDIAQIMQSQLGHVGVRVIVEAMEWGTLLERVTSTDRNFDGATMSWATDFVIDDTGLFRSDRSEDSFGFAGTNSADIDRLLDAIPTAADRTTLAGLLARYQDAVIDEQPYTFLYYADRLAGVSRRLQGVNMDVRGDWVSIREWRILPGERKYAAGG